jgi:cell shape-determining protein MreC
MSRSKRKHANNRRTIITVLILISVVGFMLPAKLTGKFLNFVQVILPFQDWTTRTADGVADALTPSGEGLSSEAAEKIRRENAALKHRLASLSGDYEDLSNAYANATQIRDRGLDQGRLIPARVVAGDAFAWRKSRLINAGTLSGVREDSAVTTHHFSLQLDETETVREGYSVLCAETLVGFVEQVGTHSARVRMLTDKSTALRVLIARAATGEFYPLSSEFWLVGTGGDSMEIRDVSHAYVKSTDDEMNLRAGDYVFTSRGDSNLPASMTIGTISEIRQDPENSLLFILKVRPAMKPSDIRQVFVVDLGRSQTP